LPEANIWLCRCNNVLWISAAKDGVKEEDTEMR